MIKKYARFIIFIAVIAALVLYLPQSAKYLGAVLRALKPVLIAVFFALIFHNPINFLSEKVFKKIKKEKLRYAIALTVVYVVIFGALFIGIYFLVPSFMESVKGFAEKLPEYGKTLVEKLNSVLAGMGMTEDKINNLTTGLGDKILSAIGGAEGIFGKLKTLGSGALNLFFSVVLSIYMLLDRKRLIRQLGMFNKAIMTDKVYYIAHKTVTVSGVIFSKFLGGQFIEAVLLAVVTLGGMYALRLPYAPLVSAVVFVSNLIPLLGAYIGGVVGFVMIAFVDIKKALIFVAFSIILQQLENNITYPKVVGNSLGLSGFWIMAAVLVGGSLFGFWGVMLGVPATAVVYKMLGYALKKDDGSGALLPDALKQPDNPSGGNGADK